MATKKIDPGVQCYYCGAEKDVEAPSPWMCPKCVQATKKIISDAARRRAKELTQASKLKSIKKDRNDNNEAPQKTKQET